MKIAKTSYEEVVKNDPVSSIKAPRATGESLTISALINTGDPEDLKAFGVDPYFFEGHPQVINWLIDQVEKTGKMPTKTLFEARWPDFPLNDHDDVLSAVEILKDKFFARRGRDTLLEATQYLQMGDVMAAKEAMNRFNPVVTAPKPRSLMSSQDFLEGYYSAELGGGIELPYRTLQEMTGGLSGGNYMVLAARSGQGKSSHAVNIAANSAFQGKRTKYYSLEMSSMEIRGKLHAVVARKLGIAGVTATAIRDRSIDREVYSDFLAKVREMQEEGEWGEIEVHTPAEGPISPQAIMSTIEDYDCVVVDLITLMQNAKGERAISDWRVAAQISNELKQIALSSNVPIVGTSQINREGDRADSPPKLSQLSQTDSLGQDADFVVTWRQRQGVVTAASVEKSRFGQSGKRFWTRFDPNHGDYREISQTQAEEMIMDAEDEL